MKLLSRLASLPDMPDSFLIKQVIVCVVSFQYDHERRLQEHKHEFRCMRGLTASMRSTYTGTNQPQQQSFGGPFKKQLALLSDRAQVDMRRTHATSCRSLHLPCRSQRITALQSAHCSIDMPLQTRRPAIQRNLRFWALPVHVEHGIDE